MRIIADHSRGAVNLIADGVVPSNEDRGYVLRRVMRRAIQQGRVLGLDPPFLGRFAERVIELMGGAYPHLEGERESIMRWVGDEEQSFGRTLDRGTELLAKLVAEAKAANTSWIDAADAFQLHDTYGFPYDLTKELLAEQGLSVDDDGFEALMDEQRERARLGAAGPVADRHGQVIEFASKAPPTTFVGYSELSAQTSVAAAEPIGDGEALLVKLEESPFYAEGGGQVADSGVIAANGSQARVEDVYRVGDDQALRVAAGGWRAASGDRVSAVVDHELRHATMRNHTATHLLHAALREALGTHVRQAGSAVRPDKLRFDFTHGAPLDPAEVRSIEDRVNGWVKASRPVRALEMERAEAEAMGAMALFGEKYGDWVRVVEVDEVSRELCGGTHVANTAEVGIVAIVSEGSSAANVRRIEALTGPAAIDWYRERSDQLEQTGALLGSAPRRRRRGPARVRAAGRARGPGRRARSRGVRRPGRGAGRGRRGGRRDQGRGRGRERRPGRPARPRRQDQAARGRRRGGARRRRRRQGGAGRELQPERGRARRLGGRRRPRGGGDRRRRGRGRPEVAQAGGRAPEKLDDALEAARAALARALS